MSKSREKLIALRLRAEGRSLKEISRLLNVSAGSVSFWCRDVILTEAQIRILEARNKDPYYGRRLEYSRKRKYERETKIQEIEEKARVEIGRLNKRDRLIAGVALYWAEGFKRDRMVGFANTDPEMIKFAIGWFIDCVEVKKENLRLRVGLNMAHKHRTLDVERYWSDLTGIPQSQFYKAYYQRSSWAKAYSNPDEYFGTLRIRVLKSTDLLRRIGGQIKAIQEN